MYWADNKLVKLLPPYQHQSDGKLALILSELKKGDAQYYKFEYFKRLSLLPFSDLLRKTTLRVNRKFYDGDSYISDVALQKAIMSAIVKRAKKNDTEVIVVKLEPLYDYQEKSIYNRLFYKYFHQDKNVLHYQLLKQSTFNIFYLSEIYKDAGGPLSRFYFHDQIHLSAEGGELLAQKIDQVINNIKKQK